MNRWQIHPRHHIAGTRFVWVSGLTINQLAIPRRSLRGPIVGNRDCTQIDRRRLSRHIRRAARGRR